MTTTLSSSLSIAGVRMNVSKSKFFSEQIGCLLYWIIREIIQAVFNIIELILNIKVPKTWKDEANTPVYRYIQLLS
jgi:hypothetical protein